VELRIKKLRIKTGRTKVGTAVLWTYDGTSLRFVTTAASPMTILAVRAVVAVVVHDSPLARRYATLKIGDFGHLDDSPFGLDES
jgi:hypothetical protein